MFQSLKTIFGYSMKGVSMQRRVKTVIACVFLAIAILYPTYTISQSMTEDVRQTLTVLKDAPEDIKDFFKLGGWDIDAEVDSIIETTAMRNEMSMNFLIIVEVICIAIAMGAMLSIKEAT